MCTTLKGVTYPTVSSHLCSVLVTSRSSAASEGSGDPPGVGLLVAVVQRLQFLHPLLPAEACRVGHSVEGRGEFYQPARVDGGHLTHVLLSGQNQLMIHEPAGQGRKYSDDEIQ